MLHPSHYIVTNLFMSIGNSGRIVIEVEPELKRQLYSALAKDGMTLKQWFLNNASSYLDTDSYKVEIDCIVDSAKKDEEQQQ